MAKKAAALEPYIGSYVLETLTTGMYAESRNALREYIQNSFDGIRAAIRAKLLTPSGGRIKVLLQDDDTLIIQDNGTGISEMSAWGTLTAIGLSKKNRQKDAGFRGIGRLAGIAFCDTLVFRTKAVGEASESIVTFNCRALRTAMTSEKEGSQPLAQLLQTYVAASTKTHNNSSEHFMHVTLKGLSEAPPEFKDLADIQNYLVETSPIDFDPAWDSGKEITANAKKAGFGIESVALYLGHTEKNASPIFKAYSDSYSVRGGSVTTQKIKYFQGVESDWWAWVGIPDRPALITDEKVSGLRIRARNIQVGRAAIFDDLFMEVSQSNDRFNKYFVGEVHVGGEKLIPNARRDGFEDNADWITARAEMTTTICESLSEIARDLSNDRQKSLTALGKAISVLEKKVGVGKVISNEAKLELLHAAAQIRKRISSAVPDADSDTRLKLKTFVDSVELIRQRLGVYSPDQKSALRMEILQEVIGTVMTVVEPYLEPQEFSRLRRALNALK
jgi:Histidine kinase-, DNA gyrase B-, and HSP90-like ATPase